MDVERGTGVWSARIADEKAFASSNGQSDGLNDDDTGGGRPLASWSRFAVVRQMRALSERRKRRVPNIDRHKLEIRSRNRLEKIRDRCMRALQFYGGVDGHTWDVGRSGADVEATRVEALAKELASGDAERRRVAATLKVIDEILLARQRWEMTKYARTIDAIPRDATRLIDAYNFKRFVHRGMNVEGMDDAAIARLFDGCLRGLRSDSLTLEKLLPVERLLKLVKSGEWERLWMTYSTEATNAALTRGVSGPSMALYSIASVDPLGPNEFEGIPSSRTLLNGPGQYIIIMLQLLFFPIVAPLCAPFSKSVRFLLHATRFIFNSGHWRQRRPSAAFVALVLYYTPYWFLGSAVIFLYFTASNSTSVTSDGIVPAAMAFALTSFVAMALSVSDVRSYDKMSAVTLYFPGGKTELPDSDSIVVQEHPTVDTLRAREVPRELRTQSTNAATKDRGNVNIDANENTVPNDAFDPNAPDAKARRTGRGRHDSDRPRWLAKMDDFSETVDYAVDLTGRKSSSHASGVGARTSHARRGSVRGETATIRDSIEDIISSNKRLQLRSVTEKEILASLLTRANEEARKTYWFKHNNTVSQRVIFAVLSILIALMPSILRLTAGHSMFGTMGASSYCVDPDRASYLPSYLDIESCSSTQTELINVLVPSVSPTEGLSDGILVILAFLWNVCTLFVLFSLSRWMCACAYHSMLHWLLFSSTTDPMLASSYDVPFINLCQSWLPWVRVRMVVEDHRELEQMWSMHYVMHMLVLVTGIIIVCLTSVIKIYFFSDISEIHATSYSPVYPLLVATVLMVPTVIIVSIAAKIYEIQEADVQQLQEARWKLFLDNCTIQSAGMDKEKAPILRKNNQSIHALSELERIVVKRNAQSWPKIFGARVGAGSTSLLWAYAFFAAALTAAAIAIDVFAETSKTTTGTVTNLRDLVRLGFAYESVP